MIVLDTHAWIWWAAGSGNLSERAERHIQRSEIIFVPAISVWEVAMLVAKERLGLDRDVEVWTGQALKLPGVHLAPLNPSIAIRATRLPGTFHGDPADRIITATALEFGCPLITKDAKMSKYRHVKTAW